MKKTILSVAVASATLFFLSNCGNSETKPTPETNPTVETKDTVQPVVTASTSEYAKGEEVFNATCKACHQANGEGLPNAFPPLAKSDYLLADKNRSIKQILKGSSAEITVNGNKFNGVMPPQDLTDEKVADVLNYVLHSWGNNGETVTPEEVKALR